MVMWEDSCDKEDEEDERRAEDEVVKTEKEKKVGDFEYFESTVQSYGQCGKEVKKHV